MKEKKLIVRGLSIVLFLMIPLGANAQDSRLLEKQKKLIKMLDALDFQEAIAEATDCTKKRDFSCSIKELKEAERLATEKEQKLELSLARTSLDNEKKLVAIEQEQRVFKEKMRRERIAEEERLREEQRQRQLAEQRAKKQKEKQQMASIGLGLLAGGLAAAGGASGEVAADVMESTAYGTYASMSGDRAAARIYQQKRAGLQQKADRLEAQRQAQLQKIERQHQESIRRHEENMRISQNKPTVKAAQKPSAAQNSYTTEQQPAERGQPSAASSRAAEQAKQERARKKREYEAQRMAEVDAARQRVAMQRGGGGSSTPAAASPRSGYGYEATINENCWDGRTARGASCLVVEKTEWQEYLGDDFLRVHVSNICEKPLVLGYRLGNHGLDSGYESGQTEFMGGSSKRLRSIMGATGEYQLSAVGIERGVHSMTCSIRAKNGESGLQLIEFNGFVNK